MSCAGCISIQAGSLSARIFGPLYYSVSMGPFGLPPVYVEAGLLCQAYSVTWSIVSKKLSAVDERVSSVYGLDTSAFAMARAH